MTITLRQRLLLLPVFLLLTVILVACDKTPDEEQIGKKITRMKKAIEQKEFSAINEHLHRSFVANDRMNAKDVKRLLHMYGMQHNKLGATILSSKTTLDTVLPGRAETLLSVVITGSSGRLLADGSVRTVTLDWIKESGDWLVRKAEWRHY
ncbi:MAG: hypothetical protein HRT77_07755 [Halioglobus sp.]|nr:hypothetical protein [Halioglobus sp.]